MLRDDGLDLRKRSILQAIIEDYITTAEPIGSRTIARRHDLGLSSATIRNEMADLEELGYLVQPHTSSGRIPSEKGYRIYVDEFVEYCELSKSELQKMCDVLDNRINDINEIIKLASGLISELTDYTSIGVTTKLKKILVKAVQVVPVEQGKALVIIVLESGTVKNNLINIDFSLSPDQLIRLSNLLNERFAGKTIEQIELYRKADLDNNSNMPNSLFQSVINGIIECLESMDSAVFTEGAINIFNYPEFQDVIKAKEFLRAMQEKDKVMAMMANSFSEGGILVRIGKENVFDELKDCSLITATYSIDDVVIGSIGIVGPTRMKYGKVLTSIDIVSRQLNQRLKKLIGDSNDRR